MNISEIKPKMRVAYVPRHALGDVKHPDLECGTVCSVNQEYVFVKFDTQVERLGWSGATAQPCSAADLVLI